MSQNGEWENIKTQYLASPISDAQRTGTKTVFAHLDPFLREKKISFKDLSQPDIRDSFKTYLKNKVPNYSSRKVYWSYFRQFLSWLETYLEIEPVSTQPKPESPPAIKGDDSSFELTLRTWLGGELASRHIAFLEIYQQKNELLQDVFRRFILRAGVQVTKEEWQQRIQGGEKVDHFEVLEPETCHYRAVSETGEWFCDGKRIEPAVCIQRQQRFLFMAQAKNNPKIKCYPKDMKRRQYRKQEYDPHKGQPKVNWGGSTADIPSSAWSGDW